MVWRATTTVELFGVRPITKKEDTMTTIVLCVAWFAVAGIVLLALAEYRKPRATR